MAPSAKTGFDASELWNTTGLTEHLGGSAASRHLIAASGFREDCHVLDAGCGSGYTACLLATEAGSRVTALDVRKGVLAKAAERITRLRSRVPIHLVGGDIQALPFADDAFDGVMCESVLAFCDQPRALAELCRVLRPGGVLGSNEMTYLRPPSRSWEERFSTGWMGVNLRPRQEGEWRALFEQAGLTVESAEVSPISLKAQAASHMEVDGMWRYWTVAMRYLVRPAIWRTFFSPSMWPLWREYPTVVGCGLYVLRKL